MPSINQSLYHEHLANACLQCRQRGEKKSRKIHYMEFYSLLRILMGLWIQSLSSLSFFILYPLFVCVRVFSVVLRVFSVVKFSSSKCIIQTAFVHDLLLQFQVDVGQFTFLLPAIAFRSFLLPNIHIRTFWYVQWRYLFQPIFGDYFIIHPACYGFTDNNGMVHHSLAHLTYVNSFRPEKFCFSNEKCWE